MLILYTLYIYVHMCMVEFPPEHLNLIEKTPSYRIDRFQYVLMYTRVSLCMRTYFRLSKQRSGMIIFMRPPHTF